MRTLAAIALLAGLVVAPLAFADVPVERLVAAGSGNRTAPAQAELMRGWSAVGRCVVQRDRTNSLAFVRASAGSDEELIAQRRLDPVFAGCLAGSRVPGPSSIVLRRAALVAALGIGSRT